MREDDGQGKAVAAYQMADFHEAMGVNDRVALSTANKIMLNEKYLALKQKRSHVAE